MYFDIQLYKHYVTDTYDLTSQVTPSTERKRDALRFISNKFVTIKGSMQYKPNQNCRIQVY